ncbi:MAG: hypothetical protein AAF357_19280 [Verrucomicrobiota bacterium]
MPSSPSPNLEPLNRHLRGDTELIDSFSRLAGRAQDFDLDHLLEEIDSSDYSAVDWAEALAEFDRWLDSENTDERPFRQMVGYVHCCTLMNAPQISLPSLKVIVHQALTEFGFEVISETQI